MTNNHNKVDDFYIEDKGLTVSDHKILQCLIRIELHLPTKALISWTKDADVVGTIKKERMFRVNFNIDEEKLKTEVNENLNIYAVQTDYLTFGNLITTSDTPKVQSSEAIAVEEYLLKLYAAIIIV